MGYLGKKQQKMPAFITWSQSAVLVIRSRIGWENIITITTMYAEWFVRYQSLLFRYFYAGL